MQRNWTHRQVNFDALYKEITQFLEENDFEISNTRTTTNGYRLTAKDSPHYRVGGEIIITIEGDPEELTITLDLKRKKEHRAYPMMLMGIFGGGSILRDQFKEDEAWTEFKRDFWPMTDKIIFDLTGTSTNATTEP